MYGENRQNELLNLPVRHGWDGFLYQPLEWTFLSIRVVPRVYTRP